MSFKEFMKHYRLLARKGWRRANDNVQVRLRRPGVKLKRFNDFSFSPLSAVYFELTGRRVTFSERGTFSRGLRMRWSTVCTLNEVSSHPNSDHSHQYWKIGLKERLMREVPIVR